MPMKRRKGKRREAVAPDAWDMLFSCGFDYFNALAPLGLRDPLQLPPESDTRTAAQTAWNDAARDAWALHGAAFMRQWEPKPGQPLPWAAKAFGLSVLADGRPSREIDEAYHELGDGRSRPCSSTRV